jgi:hypothetical protein
VLLVDFGKRLSRPAARVGTLRALAAIGPAGGGLARDVLGHMEETRSTAAAQAVKAVNRH